MLSLPRSGQNGSCPGRSEVRITRWLVLTCGARQWWAVVSEPCRGENADLADNLATGVGQHSECRRLGFAGWQVSRRVSAADSEQPDAQVSQRRDDLRLVGAEAMLQHAYQPS
jgi:hypothetical protein